MGYNDVLSQAFVVACLEKYNYQNGYITYLFFTWQHLKTTFSKLTCEIHYCLFFKCSVQLLFK